MNIKFYPKLNNGPNIDRKDVGYTLDDIEKGHMWLHADVTCPHCGKEQAVADTVFVGGPCKRCGKRTDGSDSK